MYVGIMKIELRFPPIGSIKEKRNIINSIKGRIISRFKVSIAEIDDQELYGSSILGVSFVSNTRAHADTRGQKIFTFLEKANPDVFYDYDLIVEEY